MWISQEGGGELGTFRDTWWTDMGSILVRGGLE